MPFPLIPAIGAAATLGASAIGAAASGNLNKKNRQFQQDVMQQQRNWSLEDWNMQNAYNSPTSQMARLREAGLNPNLLYGNGSTATGASTPMRPTPSADYHPVGIPAPDLGGAFSAYQNSELQQAQLDNLKAQNTVSVQEALLKAAQIISLGAGTENTKANTAMTNFDLGLKSKIQEYSVEAARLGIENMKANTQSTIDANERAAVKQNADLRTNLETILSMRLGRQLTAEQIKSTALGRSLTSQQIAASQQQVKTSEQMTPAQLREIDARIQNMQKSGELQQLEIYLRQKGLSPSDPFYMRILSRLADNIFAPTGHPGSGDGKPLSKEKIQSLFGHRR